MNVTFEQPLQIIGKLHVEIEMLHAEQGQLQAKLAALNGQAKEPVPSGNDNPQRS